MIYWVIRYPGKSWRDWADGVSDDELDAQRDAMESLLDDDHQLQPWAKSGVTVRMYRMVDIDDFHIDEKKAEAFRTNYLGLKPTP